MADISYLQNADVEDTDEQMANTIEDSNDGEYQRDNESDSGGSGDDEGGGDALHPMAKLQQYALCEMVYNRQLVGRILVDIFRHAVDHCTGLNVSEVMQPVHKLVNDTDPIVRLELIEQLPHVAMICQEAPERFGNVLSNHLIHLIATLHHDEDQQVRQSTHTALLTLIERGLLDKDSIEFVVAPTLLMMGQQPAKLEYVTLAIDDAASDGFRMKDMGSEMFLRQFASHYLVFHVAKYHKKTKLDTKDRLHVLLRSGTSNWLWNVAIHITATLMRFYMSIDRFARQSGCDVVILVMHITASFDERYSTINPSNGMSKVAPLLDPATAERLFLQRYLSLCRDENFFIRKLCAIHFGEFSVSMAKETIYTKLLPTYLSLCKDPVWTVRKSCAEVMVSIACCVSLDHRRTTLSQILANFLGDESKWVKLSAYQILGPFISTFAKQFTGFAYNQYGELVLTDQHGTELRYNMISFSGSPDSSAACKSSADEEYENNSEMLTPKFTASNQREVKRVSNDLSTRTRTMENENEEIEGLKEFREFVATLKEEKKGRQKEEKNLFEEDPNRFSPFLYYYIPPDLPLDDELVKAASEDSQSKIPMSAESVEVNQNNATSNDENNIPTIDVTSTESKAGKQNECPPTVVMNVTKSDISIFKNSGTKRKKSKRQSEHNWNEEHAEEHSPKETDSKTELNDTIDVSVDTSSEISFCEKMNTSDKSINDFGSQTIVPQVLIDFFVSMANPDAWWNVSSAEIPRFCAFYFPAVVLTLGRDNWGMLKTAYSYLSDAREYKVRRTMASSIHEVAMILGEELSAQDLLPIYDGFIKDLDEVRIGALKHLATFLKVLKPVDRCQFLPRLKGFLTRDNEWSEWNWRFREEVARRLLETIPLYSTQDVSIHIAPLSFPLLVDKVAAVRHMALALVTQIISYLSTDDELITAIIQELRTMLTANSSRWTCRQTYALLCASLLSSEAISGERFAKELLPCLLTLSSDVVPNVRLAVVRTLTTQVFKIINTLGPEQTEKVNQKLRVLRQDPDRDVRMLAGGIAGKYQAKWPDEPILVLPGLY